MISQISPNPQIDREYTGQQLVSTNKGQRVSNLSMLFLGAKPLLPVADITEAQNGTTNQIFSPMSRKVSMYSACDLPRITLQTAKF